MLGEQGLMAVLLKIQEWSKTNPYLLNKVFGNIRALTADLSLMGGNLEYNEGVIKRVSGAYGDLNRDVVAFEDTIKVTMDKIKSQIHSSMTILGDDIAKLVIPTFKALANELDKITTRFDSMSEGAKKTRVHLLEFIVALGPLSLLGSLLVYIGSGLTKLISVLGVATGAAGKFLGFLMDNPYVAAAAGLILVIKGLTDYENKVKAMAYAHDTFNTSLETVNGTLKKLKDLTKDDIDAMNSVELTKTATDAQKEWVKADKLLRQLQSNKAGFSWWERLFGANKNNDAMINETTAKITKLKAVYNEAGEAQYKLWDDKRIASIAAMVKKTSDVVIEESEKEQKAWQNLADGMAYIDRMTKISGGTFDATGEKLKLFDKVIKELADTDIPLTDKAFRKLIKNFLDLGGTFDGSEKAMKKYFEELKYINMLAKASEGGTRFKFDIDTAQLSLAKKTLDDLLKSIKTPEGLKESSIWISALSKDVDILQSKLDARKMTYLQDMSNTFKNSTSYVNMLGANIDFLTVKMEELSVAGRGNSEQFKEYAKQIQNLSIQQGILEGLTNSFNDLFMSIATGAGKGTDSLKNFANSVLQMFERIIAQHFAEKLAFALFPKKGIGNLLSLEGGGGSKGGGIGSLLSNLLPLVIPMLGLAKGGTVPGGYPGDTYPALLTSGETVVPYNAMKQQSMNFDPVEFVIKENQLTGILKKADTKNSIY